MDKISNDEVLQRINETKTMLDTLQALAMMRYINLRFTLHYTEKTQTCVVRACARTRAMLHDITEGRMKGKAI